MLNRIIYLASIVAIVSLLLALYSSFKNLTVSANGHWPVYSTDTGFTGDTIGGITAPFINGIGSILLFITIWIQIDTNKKQEEKHRLDRLYETFVHEFDSIRTDINNFSYLRENQPYLGVRAVQLFVLDFNSTQAPWVNSYFTNTQFGELLFIVTATNNLVDSIVSSDLSESDKQSLFRRIQALYEGKVKGCMDTLAGYILERNIAIVDAVKFSDRVKELNTKFVNPVLSIGTKDNPTKLPDIDLPYL